MQETVNHKWRKSADGCYKCNIDAAFSSSTNIVGLGLCIRDDQGSFVLAKTEWIPSILSVDEEILGSKI